MEEYRCPAAQRNKEAHAEFVHMFSTLYEQWQNSGPNPHLVDDVYYELQDWIINHIQHVDTGLLPCVRHG